MSVNPLIRIRLLLVDKTIQNATVAPSLADHREEIELLKADFDAIRPFLEAAPGIDESAPAMIRGLIAQVKKLPLILRLQVAELILAYVTVQLMHFAQLRRDRELTETERRFGTNELDALAQGAMILLATRPGED